MTSHTSVHIFQTLYGVDLTTRRAMGSQLEDIMQECSWSGLVCTPLSVLWVHQLIDDIALHVATFSVIKCLLVRYCDTLNVLQQPHCVHGQEIRQLLYV